MASCEAEQAAPSPPPPPGAAPPPRVFENRSKSIPDAPDVPANGRPGSFLVELLVFNGYPFKDHWSFYVRSHSDPNVGVVLHATGDVRNGFHVETKRSHGVYSPPDIPSKRIPLQWVEGRFFDEAEMLNHGRAVIDASPKPTCEFEASAMKVEAPGKSLNDESTSGIKVVQRNCQTWIVESATQLAKDGIFHPKTVSFLSALEQ